MIHALTLMLPAFRMYAAAGIHWASMVPALLALICVPLPFLFFKFGPKIRARCKYAAESDVFMKRMQKEMEHGSDGSTDETSSAGETQEEKEKEREEEEQEAIDYSYEAEEQPEPRFEQIKTNQARPQGARRGTSYEGNPFDLDRVNTRSSFNSERRPSGGRQPSRMLSRASSRASRR